MNDGTKKDVPVTEVTPENYIVAENAKQMYHCVIEVRKFDANTGKRLSKPRIQTFGKKAFENTVSLLKRQGYTVTILYDPTEYLASKRAEVAEQKPVAQTKTTEQMIAEAVAKALAEQEEKHRQELDAKIAEAVKGVTTKKGGRKPKKEADAEQTNNAEAEEKSDAEAENEE